MPNEEALVLLNELTGGQDDIQSSEAGDNPGGEEAHTDAVPESGSGSGALDTPEHDTASGLEDDDEDREAVSAERNDEPVTLGELAESMDVEPAELYDMQVPIGDGVTASISEMKDSFKEYGPVHEYREKTQADRAEYEKTLLQTRSELNALMSVIPENMREHMVGIARERQAAWKGEQEKQVLEAIPDWQDPTRRAADRDSLVSRGAEYGFSEAELTYTDDARVLRWLIDSVKDRQELETLRTAAKAAPGKAGGTGRAASHSNSRQRKLRSLVKAGREAKNQRSKEQIISDILKVK